jgi:prepilin-type N-terminal cleavage/methylation domain-containing protein
MPRNESGFTLLEVMAAVALLGLVYTVLGNAGIQGLQHEGEAERRITASLLADQVLEEIEAGLAAGVAPRPGEEQREAGDYAVTVRVEPFDLVLPEVEPPEGREGGRARRPGQSRREQAAPASSLLVGQGGRASPLRRIEVEVRWVEGWGERSVARTTFALDPEEAAPALAALDAAAPAAGGQPGGRLPPGGTGGPQ